MFATRNVVPTELSKEKDEAVSTSTSAIPEEQASSMSDSDLGRGKQNVAVPLSSTLAALSPSKEKKDMTNDSPSSNVSYTPITIQPSPRESEYQKKSNETGMK